MTATRKPRRPRQYREQAEQSAVIAWANLRATEIPELRLLHAVQNWAGVKGPAEGAARKREGVKAGVPDLCLPVPRGEHHGLYIEMKAMGAYATAEQRWWLAELTRQGYRAVVCRGFEAARREIEAYLAG